MRYVKIPAAVSLPHSHVIYLWATFLDEFVWESKEWRADASSLDALVRAHAIADGNVGDVVALSDEDHERLVKLVRDANIPGAVQFPLAPFCRAISGAASTPPEPVAV